MMYSVRYDSVEKLYFVVNHSLHPKSKYTLESAKLWICFLDSRFYFFVVS